MLQTHLTVDKLEAGLDEVARGCLAGPVFASAVIWPRELENPLEHPILKDSKKLSRKQRDYLKDYIEETAIDFSVASMSNSVIDKVNILNATHMAMHKAIQTLNVEPDFLIVDGNSFQPYFTEDNELIEHKCIVKGDNKFASISAASILAKVYHDNYIDSLLEEDSDLEKYHWDTNMCYGTKEHLDAIREFGLTKHHRRSFGICKHY